MRLERLATFTQRFVIAVVAAGTLMSCQQGKKIDSGSSVYTEGITQCERIASELESYRIAIDGPVSTEPAQKKNEVPLPDGLEESGQMGFVQKQLERYILTAQKLLALGDTNAVVFPEKEKIQVGLLRASKYLGQIYAKQDWATENNPVTNSDIDYQEYAVRLGRVSAGLRRFDSSGLMPDQVFVPYTVSSRVKELDSKDLEDLKPYCESLMRDLMRMRTLGERNDYWKLKGLKVMSDQTDHFNGAFWAIGDAARTELKRRSSKAKKP